MSLKIDDLIQSLITVSQEHGNIDVLIADQYTHYEVKYVDYYEARLDTKEHFCIRLRDDNQ